MTWIRTVPPEEADGPLARVYEAVGSSRGGVAEIHRALSLHPRALRAHLDLYRAVMFSRSSLDRTMRERLGVVVSQANGCAYCVAHHRQALVNLGDDPATIEALATGRAPPESAGPAALYLWARHATLDPALARDAQLGPLRDAGLDDAAALDAVLTVAYFNFVNRLVLLLGVDLEEDFEDYCGEDASIE